MIHLQYKRNDVQADELTGRDDALEYRGQTTGLTATLEYESEDLRATLWRVGECAEKLNAEL